MTPPISIIRRVHPRARRLKLTFRAGQFWLTIPPRCSERHIQIFITQSHAWCMAQLAQHHQTSASDIDALDVRLPCLDEIWHHADGQWIEQQTGIAVQFATTQAQQHWVVQRATPYLTLRLAELAAQHELVYRHCRVSRMRSRWGSCSASAKIHLNAGLVFLDTTQIDYVLLHELCHTKQMNHSVAFWQEMMRVCPDFARLRGSLKRMRLPQWWMEMS